MCLTEGQYSRGNIYSSSKAEVLPLPSAFAQHLMKNKFVFLHLDWALPPPHHDELNSQPNCDRRSGSVHATITRSCSFTSNSLAVCSLICDSTHCSLIHVHSRATQLTVCSCKLTHAHPLANQLTICSLIDSSPYFSITHTHSLANQLIIHLHTLTHRLLYPQFPHKPITLITGSLMPTHWPVELPVCMKL